MAMTTSATPRARSRGADRAFYTGMALAIAVTVFAGFSRTYYLKGYFGSPPLPPLRHLHGLLFSAWVVLLVAQAGLVSARRIDLHRRIGAGGVLLAASMLVVGAVTAVDAARRGASPPGIDPLAFLIVPFADIGVFGILVLAAVWLRGRPETHKRLMLVATVSILTAAIARLPGVMDVNPLAFFAVTDLFLLPLAIHDVRSRGRIHPATIWGGLLLVASQPVRVVLSGTPAWLSLAARLVGP